MEVGILTGTRQTTSQQGTEIDSRNHFEMNDSSSIASRCLQFCYLRRQLKILNFPIIKPSCFKWIFAVEEGSQK